MIIMNVNFQVRTGARAKSSSSTNKRMTRGRIVTTHMSHMVF